MKTDIVPPKVNLDKIAKATLTMVFKLCKKAEKNRLRLKGFEKLQLVKEGKTFVDGILQVAV